MTWFFDDRWCGDHGIGRFARELKDRLPFESLALAGKPSSPMDPFRLVTRVRCIGADSALFSPGYNGPLFSRYPFVFTLHDLNHIDRPENSSFLKRIYYRIILKYLCRHSKIVLTVSEFSRRRIIEWSGVRESAVVNVGNGVGSAFCVHGPADYFDFKYWLCISNRRLHKNEERVLRGFHAANLGPYIKLVFSGEMDERLGRLIDELALGGRVVFAGRVSEESLPTLYRGARALIFPSLYEGFGLPVLEAMASGIPVVTSATTSLPEVAGGAALLVNPLSVDEIASAIHRVETDDDLRIDLCGRGIRRAADFSWESVALKVRAALETVCKFGSEGAGGRIC